MRKPRLSPPLKKARHRYRIGLESLEPRLLLYHGPTVFPDGSIEVALDDTLDQFGFQVAMFQAYENLVSFSIFDTGASVVTVSATDQLLFDLFGTGGVPIKVRCGAEAQGVGGTLTGHVSEPGTVMADGLHVANLTFDEFGFPIFDIQFDPATAAIVPGVQAFVGALTTSNDPLGCPPPASEVLPTITGTPILAPSPDHPNGTAALIRPQGELLDFSDFPELNGLVIPVPDLTFQSPGLGIPADPACIRLDTGLPLSICTDPVRVPLQFVGFDNYADPGDVPTEAFNPVNNFVRLEHNGQSMTDQIFLLDTGAQLSVLSYAQAEALGLDLDNPQTSVAIQGAAGAVHDVPGYTIDHLSMPLEGGGRLTFVDVPIYLLDVAPGIIDGILGMNLFNNAASVLYDPFDAGGPVMELSFFTEHFFEDIDLGGDQFSILRAMLPAFAATISGGRLPSVSPQDSVPPHLTIAAPPLGNDPTPAISVSTTAPDLADGSTISLDVDLNNDGDFNDPGELGRSTGSLATGSARFEINPPLAEGSYSVRVRATDPAGNEGSSASQPITIDLTAPLFLDIPQDMQIPATGPGGAIVAFTPPTAVDAVDPDPGVICAPLSGSMFPIGRTMVRCATMDDAGNPRLASFAIEVLDLPGGSSGSIEFDGTALTITGTDQGDSISLIKSGKGFRVQTTFGNLSIPRRKSLERVVIHSGGGSDSINVASLGSKQSALIDGGAGDDSIVSGGGSDVVIGGVGNDVLTGQDGNNVLIGGQGVDRLLGGPDSDVLVGGELDPFLGSVDWPKLFNDWRRARSASAKLAAVQSLIDYALDDAAADVLSSSRGSDLFVADVLDKLADRRSDDVVV